MSIIIDYYSFSPTRADKKWPSFVDDISTLRDKIIGDKKDLQLTKDQENIKRNLSLDYLIYEEEFNKEDLIFDLKVLDIYYGSVRNKEFENPKVEFLFLNSLLCAYNLKTEEVPSKEKWIKIFQNIDDQKIETASDFLVRELSWSKEDSVELLKDYLLSVRPVVKDLKETSDAVFIKDYERSLDLESTSVEKILSERAEEHYLKYKGEIPPVI